MESFKTLIETKTGQILNLFRIQDQQLREKVKSCVEIEEEMKKTKKTELEVLFDIIQEIPLEDELSRSASHDSRSQAEEEEKLEPGQVTSEIIAQGFEIIGSKVEGKQATASDDLPNESPSSAKKSKNSDSEESQVESTMSSFQKMDSADLINTKNGKTMTMACWLKWLNQNTKKRKMMTLAQKKDKKLLKSFLKNGIPIELRAHIWMLLSGGFLHLDSSKFRSNDFQYLSLDHKKSTESTDSAPNLQKSEKSYLNKPQKGYENKGLSSTQGKEAPPNPLEDNDRDSSLPEVEVLNFKELQKNCTKESLSQIDKDIHRTSWPMTGYVNYLRNSKGMNAQQRERQLKEFKNLGVPEFTHSEEQVILNINKKLKSRCRKVLAAYSAADPSIKYTQGMHAICMTIVYQFFLAKHRFEAAFLSGETEMNLEFSGEEAFYAFYGVMQYMRVNEAYQSGFEFMMSKIDRFGVMLKHKDPELHDRLEEAQIPHVAYFSTFYLTIFQHMVPVQHSHKIFTAFLLIGYDVVDHILMGMLTFNKQKIIEMEEVFDLSRFIQREMVRTTLEYDFVSSLFLIDSLEMFTGDFGIKSSNRFDALIVKDIQEQERIKRLSQSDDEEEHEEEDGGFILA